MRNNFSIINVHKKNNTKSEVVTQLLFGETFTKLKRNGSWIKIKNDKDGYVGYIKNKKFSSNLKNTHKVYNLFSTIYSKPLSNYKTRKKLSFGSEIKVLEKKDKFYKFDNLWIKKKDLKKINFSSRNIFNNAIKFINVKYKWGGKYYNGIDCSALVQLCLNNNQKFCPRDTKDQIKFFKNKISLKNLRKNDLIFWKGHVAIVISKTKLIHAYGPLKRVIIAPIKKTIDKIYKTANLKVIGARRLR